MQSLRISNESIFHMHYLDDGRACRMQFSWDIHIKVYCCYFMQQLHRCAETRESVEYSANVAQGREWFPYRQILIIVQKVFGLFAWDEILISKCGLGCKMKSLLCCCSVLLYLFTKRNDYIGFVIPFIWLSVRLSALAQRKQRLHIQNIYLFVFSLTCRVGVYTQWAWLIGKGCNCWNSKIL